MILPTSSVYSRRVHDLPVTRAPRPLRNAIAFVVSYRVSPKQTRKGRERDDHYRDPRRVTWGRGYLLACVPRRTVAKSSARSFVCGFLDRGAAKCISPEAGNRGFGKYPGSSNIGMSGRVTARPPLRCRQTHGTRDALTIRITAVPTTRAKRGDVIAARPKRTRGPWERSKDRGTGYGA